MKKVIILIIILFISGCSNESIILTNESTNYDTSTCYGYLKIPSIDMYLGFYNTDSDLNDVSKNVTLIDTNIENTYLLVAHSGIGPLAYFNDLRYLDIDDDIYLEFKDRTNHYKVVNITSVKKTGTISIKNEENQLILSTCDQINKGYQLTIESELVE